jgi:hypothetical protein
MWWLNIGHHVDGLGFFLKSRSGGPSFCCYENQIIIPKWNKIK